MTGRLKILFAAAILSVFIAVGVARADIFQWEYIDPTDPSQGKQQSTTLAPDGAGVNATAGADLTLRDLTMAYMIGADLSGASAYGANLADAELSFAFLAGAKLGAFPNDPNSAGAEGATLSGANLTQANLTNADFSGYSAYNADAPDPVNSSVYYYGANFLNADFTGSEVRGANFTGSGGITLAQLYSTGSYQARDLTGIRLPGHNLSGANLAGQNLANADLSGFQISSFHEVQSTDLTGANLTNARFVGANFNHARLGGADARGSLNLNVPHTANTENLIQSDGRIAGLDLLNNSKVIIRDYDGNPAASPPTGPLPIVVTQHMATDASGTLRLEFDADSWDSSIAFEPGIPVTLDGTLELVFAAGVNVAAQSGRTIDLFNWAGVTPTGAFTISSPYTWDISNLFTTGEVTLTAVGGLLSCDFNGDSVIDGTDLATWRSGFGITGSATQAQGDADGDRDADGGDFLTWQRQLGSGVASAAVPEPGMMAPLLATGFTLHRRRKSCSPSPSPNGIMT